MKRTHRAKCVVACAVTLGLGQVALGQTLPWIKGLVPGSVATGANSSGSIIALGSFTYNPATDSIYAAGFTADNQQLRYVYNLDSGTPSFNSQVYATEWLLWNRDGDPDYGGGTPTPGGMLINPKAVGDAPAYSFAVIVDAGAVLYKGPTSSRVYSPERTKRVYTYNLNASSGDASAVFTSVASLGDFMTAAGTTNTTSNMGRQPAFSSDGQSLYVIDTSTTLGGVWRVSLTATGGSAVTRLSSDNVDNNTEPAVRREGNLDAIYIRGGGSTGNTGGIDKYLTDGTTAGTSARQVAVSAATIRDFLETTSTVAIASMAADEEGNIYFNNTTSGSPRGIFRLDEEGRLSKVVSYIERQITFGGTPNTNTLRMQFRTTTNVPSGDTRASITQLLYAESSPVNQIAAVTLYDVGDFDLDGVAMTTGDLSLFKSALRTRGVAVASNSHLVADLNGNGVVDWKDVKILQTFAPSLHTGDANFDLAVDINDLNIVRDNYLGTGKTWLTGDFASLSPTATTYSTTAADVNVTDLVDLQALANTWRNELNQPTLTWSQLDANGYHGQFRADVISTFAVTTPVSSTWNLSSGGTWGVSGNWTDGIPDGPGITAVFGDNGTAPRTVNVTESRFVGAISFDSEQAYTVAGTAAIRLEVNSGSAGVSVNSGSHTVSAPVQFGDAVVVHLASGSSLALTGTVSTEGNAWSVTGGGTLTLSGTVSGASDVSVASSTLIAQTALRSAGKSLTVSGSGQVRLDAPGGANGPTVVGEFATLQVASGSGITLTPTDRSTSGQKLLVANTLDLSGTIDLTNNDLIVLNGDASALFDSVATWFAGGTFSGPGHIISSVATRNDGIRTLGVAPNSFLGLSNYGPVALTADSVIVKYTYLGDTDLSGVVDTQDISNLIQGLRQNLTGWQYGDNNYDGVVDANDLANLLKVMQLQGASLGNTGIGNGTTIPEPATLGLISVLFPLTLLRRR